MTEIKRDPGMAAELDSGAREEKLERWKTKILADCALGDRMYGARNRAFDTYRNWYYKNHYNTSLVDTINEAISIGSEGRGSMPSNVEDEHLSIINIPTNVIDTAHTMIMNEFPTIEALSNSESASALKRQSSVERFIVGTYYINRQVQGVDPISDCVQNMLLYGWGCLRCLWDIEREKLLDRAKDFVTDWMFPIVVQSVSPYLIYPLPGGRYERWRAIYYRCFRPKADIEEEWGVTINPNLDEEGNPTEELYDETPIEYVDYWCWEGAEVWNAVMAYGEFVKEPVHMRDYDSLPYEIVFCREGPDKTKGDTLGLSLLYTVLEAVRELELLANRQLRAIELYADPPLVTTRQPDAPPIDVEAGPGARIEIEVGESANYLSWPGSAPDVERAKDFWSKLIQEFSFPDIFSGVVGGTSGLDTVALQQGGMTKVFSPRQNMEQALERLNTKIIRLFQKRRPRKSLYVRGIRTESDEEHAFSFNIVGKDTKGFEYSKVTIRAKFPQEELRNAALAQGLVATDLYSARDAMTKFLYVQDAERMVRRRDEEKARSHPAWLEFHIQQLTTQPPQSPIGKAAIKGKGPTVAEEGNTPAPPPSIDETVALATEAGAGAVAPTSKASPLSAITAQARNAQ